MLNSLQLYKPSESKPSQAAGQIASLESSNERATSSVRDFYLWHIMVPLNMGIAGGLLASYLTCRSTEIDCDMRSVAGTAILCGFVVTLQNLLMFYCD